MLLVIAGTYVESLVDDRRGDLSKFSGFRKIKTPPFVNRDQRRSVIFRPHLYAELRKSD